MDIGVRPEGHVTIELRNADGVRRLEFDNLVTDAGWARLLDRATLDTDAALLPQYLRFGLNDEEPTRADDGLNQPIALIKYRTSVAYGGLVDSGSLTAYSQAIVRFDYDAGELSGQRLTELGLCYGSTGTESYNRALVRDENRVPTALVCLPDDTVTVYVRLRLYLTGWGTAAQLGPYAGVIQMTGGAQSTTANMWVKGLPVRKVTIGDQTTERLTPVPPNYEHYLFHGPYSTLWEASLITFYGRDNASFMTVTIPQPFVWLAPDNVMHWRINILFQRADV